MGMLGLLLVEAALVSLVAFAFPLAHSAAPVHAVVRSSR